MADFRYMALDRSGKAISGTVSAEDRPAAIAALAGQEVFVTEMAEAAPTPGRALTARTSPWRWGRFRGGVSLRSKTSLLRQLATALKAGLPLLSSLQAVQEQLERPATRELVGDLAARVQAGESLSHALEAHPREFTPLESSMVRVGETAGVLDQVMGHLSEFAERDLDLRQKIRSAAAYPLFVLGLALVSVVIVVTVILPRILATVTENVRVLPGPTAAVVGFVDLMRAYGWLLGIAVALCIWALRRWVSKPAGRLAFDRLKLRLPAIGTALRRASVARFARTLGTLSRAGIGILEALRVLRNTLGNEALAQELDRVAARITQGQSIAEPLRQTGQFPPLLIQVIAMGERTGKLDELLLQTADAYEKETAEAVGRAMTLLPAVFVVLLAMVVAFILAAVLLPIVSMETSVPGL